MSQTLTLFLIIFLEGYVVLSTELLAIRLLIPFTGSGTDTVSVIIAAVLMPLAFGYYAGGRFRTRKNGTHKSTVRKRLLLNLAVSAALLTPGLSWVVLDFLFKHVRLGWGWNGHVIMTTLYALVFLVYPVFLLGQTVPLVSNYFSKARLPVMAGKILFFSTLGSFVGAIFCTLVLMTFAGVHYAVVVTIGCIALLSVLLSKKITGRETLAAIACALVALALNNGFMMKQRDIVANNTYHMIRIGTYGHMRTMKINNNMSASLDTRTGKSAFEYILYIERTFIDPVASGISEPIDILVIGAGGFTVGKTDRKNNYIYLDLDKDLLGIAENELLGEKLTPNKRFEPVEARAWLRENPDLFDLIILDAFRGPSFSPEHLVTKEFFQQIRNALKPGGIMAANILVSPLFSDPYAAKLDNTIRSVFSNVNRQVIQDYDAWSTGTSWPNVIYSARNDPDAPTDIYTDDKNSAMFDKPGRLR